MSLSHGAAIAVAPFENESLESDAGLMAARAATHAVAERGGTIATAAGSVDLHGRVERVAAVPDGAGWWRVDGRLHLELIDAAHPDKPLARSTVSDSERYRSAGDALGGDAAATEAARRIATDRLLQKLVSIGLDRLAP